MKTKRAPPIGLVVLCSVGGFLLALLYFFSFSPCIDQVCAGITLPYNTPDHFVYAAVIENIADISWWAPVATNYGVSLLYTYLLMPITGTSPDQLVGLSLTVNLSLYVASIASFLQLTKRFGISYLSVVPLVFYPPFLFFSALINKDLFLILLLLRLVLALIEKRIVLVASIGFLLGLVRFQYAVLPMLALFLMNGKFRRRFLVAYVITSLAAAQITRFTDFFELEQADSGIASLVYFLNREYGVGSLVLNPIRALQYPLAFAQGWTRALTDDGVDLMKVIEGFTFFWFAFVAPGALRFFRSIQIRQITSESNVLRATILSFLLVLLLTSITEPRYLMSLYPLLLIASSTRKQGVSPAGRSHVSTSNLAVG